MAAADGATTDSLVSFDPSTHLSQLRERLSPVAHLCMSDVSDGHTVPGAESGRATLKGSREYMILVVSDWFSGMTTLARHRAVQDVFRDAFRSGHIHARRLLHQAPRLGNCEIAWHAAHQELAIDCLLPVSPAINNPQAFGDQCKEHVVTWKVVL